jgi:hypothetical protein
VLDHYLEVFRIKPGAFPGATALARARARASGAFTATHDELWAAHGASWATPPAPGPLIEVLLLHRRGPRDCLLAGVRAALAVVPIGALSRYDRPKPALNGYDNLLEASS